MLAVVVVAYAVIFGGILVWSGGLPFITDNNESFSSLWHARNMAEYGLRGTYLLTDEVFSPHAEAHPFVHTHQGNFPRLYAFVLYVLGARSIEAQIVITTFTVGALTMWLCFHLFSKVAGPRFACLVALVLMTDYLLFAQWQVVTYRVWHAFFVFIGLVCAQGLAETAGPARWLALVVACWAGLFYYELVFAAFASIFSGLYAAWLMRRSLWRVIGFGSAQVLGGAVALAILMAQLIAYLGWDGVREDLAVTYVARNMASDSAAGAFSPNSVHAYFGFIGRLSATDPELQARLERFYSENNVIFWWNLVDSRPLRDLSYFTGSIFIWMFQIYTPLLVLLVGIVLAGWLLGVALSAVPVDRIFPRWHAERRSGLELKLGAPLLRGRLMLDLKLSDQPAPAWVGRALTLGRIALSLGPFAVALLFLLITVFRDQAFLGLPASSASFLRASGGRAFLACLVGAVAGCALLSWLVTGRALAPHRLPLLRCWLASALLVGIATAIRRHGAFYDQEYAPIWHGQIEATAPLLLSRLAVLAAVGLAVALVFRGDRQLLGVREANQLRQVVPVVIIGSIAYGAVYSLAAGYVLTGYLVRYGPLLVFVTDLLIAMALMIVIRAAVSPLARLRDQPGQAAFLKVRAAPLAGALVVGALGLFLTGYWLHAQTYYARQFPPTHYSFLKQLREAPYAGETFVVSTYAAPVAWQTQQWAYFDPVFGQDAVTLENGNVKLQRDLKTYVWLADRATNAAYQRPTYFICLTPNHMRGVLQRITNAPEQVGRCSDMPIVRNALAGRRSYLAHQVVARDLSALDSWAILRLDWTLPPGARLVSDSGFLPSTNFGPAVLGADLSSPASGQR